MGTDLRGSTHCEDVINYFVITNWTSLFVSVISCHFQMYFHDIPILDPGLINEHNLTESTEPVSF